MRLINQIVIGFPADLIREISPAAAKQMRPLIKAPMILILYVIGV